VRGRADIVEQIRETPATEPSGRWSLRMLYFGKAFATDVVCDLDEDTRLATEADHAQARVYAERFKDDEESREKRGVLLSNDAAAASAAAVVNGSPVPVEAWAAPSQLEMFPSPAGEGESGAPGRRAKRARGARGPSGGAARRRRRGGALDVYGWIVAAMCGRKPHR